MDLAPEHWPVTIELQRLGGCGFLGGRELGGLREEQQELGQQETPMVGTLGRTAREVLAPLRLVAASSPSWVSAAP